MTNETILIVDDSIEMLEVLRRHLQSMNFTTFQCTNVNDAIGILNQTTIDLLITDLQMPGINGMELVKYTSEHFPSIPKLVITGHPSVSNAVEAVRSGAIDYLVKPFTKEELISRIELSLVREKRANKHEKANVVRTVNFKAPMGIIGQSEKIQHLAEIIDRVKDVKATVLISGESGTGKELVARAIHYTSKYTNSPFISVNCGGIPENLLESELFGYVKGAFTGANETRAGFFQAAEGGTIFLDEIGNASLNVQTRLLRVLQEKEITMVGSNKPVKIDVRIVSATNADLKKQCEQGTFREDLYYRLNVLSIEMPPLRERTEDIPLLTKYFLHKYSREFAKDDVQIDPRALEMICRYNFPGNIRELENLIQRLVILNDRLITIEDLPAYLKSSIDIDNDDSSTSLKTLKEIELDYIKKVLVQTNYNKSKAAIILGIDRKTLRQKIGD